MTTAIISGVAGQDGSYLAELLIEKGYRVVGLVNPRSDVAPGRLRHLLSSLDLIPVDLESEDEIRALVARYLPDEIYNLAARASSAHLFSEPVVTGELNALTVTRFLEAIRAVNRNIRFCQAASSEIFGEVVDSPQDEQTPFRPRNPYGVAKLYAYWMVANYRQHYGLHACSSILFNHESPRRRLELVTRKITRAVAEIKLGRRNSLVLGNLDARRDWGFAGDYVRGMWMMLQAAEPDDYVLATGQTHSVRDFCEIAFRRVGLDYRNYVTVEAQPQRQRESVQLVGNAAKAARVMGWTPSLSFEELVHMMVDADLAEIANSLRN